MEKRWKKTISDFLGKTVHVVVDRPIGYQHKGITYPIHYGYIPGALADDGEEQDAYILGVDPFGQPGMEMYKHNMFRLLGKPGYE